MQEALFAFDREYRTTPHFLLCGVDEAGRGPLAGPVVAAGVILPADMEIAYLNDSKKLSEKRRETLFEIITQQAVAYRIAFVDERTIDEVNILQATYLAMQEAVAGLSPKPDLILVDGNHAPDFGEIPTQSIVKGDGKSASIAAASILAKVARDRFMRTLDEQYPQYGFAKHKGYPTKAHYEQIEAYGISPVHRRSFLKTLERHRGAHSK